MLRFRPFRNIDPPAYTQLWRSISGSPGYAQPVSVDLFEQFVFGKLHFEYPGLIFAFDDDRPVGFVHASFGYEHRRGWLDRSIGVIAIVVTRPDARSPALISGLLERAEEHLVRGGATTIYAGSHRPHCPFYVGLYGGADVAGILESEAEVHAELRQRGYEVVQQVDAFRRELASFQPPMDRQQLQCRRRMLVQVLVEPPLHNRWEAVTLGDFDLTRFELVPRGGSGPMAYALVRDMMLGDGSYAGRTAAVLELETTPAARRQGLATFLLSEAFRMLANQGFTQIEAHASGEIPATRQLLNKLGFARTAGGTVYRKRLAT